MSNQEPTSKRRFIVLTGLLALVMLITGTWAWLNFTHRAEDSSNNGGRLHNDYNGENTGRHNQDIYAENFGENDLFVRVQLREYLALGGVPVGNGSGIDINNPTTWSIYNSATDDVTTREEGSSAALIGEKGISLRFGGHKVFMPSFNHATHEAESIDPSVPKLYRHVTAYRMTNATGRSVDATASTFDTFNIDVTSMIEIGAQTGPGTTNGEASVGSGGHHDWYLGQIFEAPLLKVDDSGRLNLTDKETHTAQRTLLPTPVNQNGVNVTNGVMTLTQWQEADRPYGNFWILDTENYDGGWFYWANPLLPGEATSLLVTELTINEQKEDWAYIITPKADFVTREEIDTLPDLSADAKELWARGSTELKLPEAAKGCGQIGTPSNVWTDSTGAEWCVVDTIGDYSMLVSRRSHQLPEQDGLTQNLANRNRTTNIFVPWTDATAGENGPGIRGPVNIWFDNDANVSPELRDSTAHARLPNLNNVVFTTDFSNRNSDLEPLSLPVEGSQYGLPFFLLPADLHVRLAIWVRQ